MGPPDRQGGAYRGPLSGSPDVRYWRELAVDALLEVAWWRSTFSAEEMERHATRSRLIREAERR